MSWFARHAFLVATILVSQPIQGHGMPPLLEVILGVSYKQACDAEVPGYAEKTSNVYKKWTAQNSQWLEQMKRAKYDGMAYPDFIEKIKNDFLKEYKEKLPKVCEDVAARFERPILAPQSK